MCDKMERKHPCPSSSVCILLFCRACSDAVLYKCLIMRLFDLKSLSGVLCDISRDVSLLSAAC